MYSWSPVHSRVLRTPYLGSQVAIINKIDKRQTRRARAPTPFPPPPRKKLAMGSSHTCEITKLIIAEMRSQNNLWALNVCNFEIPLELKTEKSTLQLHFAVVVCIQLVRACGPHHTCPGLEMKNARLGSIHPVHLWQSIDELELIKAGGKYEMDLSRRRIKRWALGIPEVDFRAHTRSLGQESTLY